MERIHRIGCKYLWLDPSNWDWRQWRAKDGWKRINLFYIAHDKGQKLRKAFFTERMEKGSDYLISQYTKQ